MILGGEFSHLVKTNWHFSDTRLHLTAVPCYFHNLTLWILLGSSSFTTPFSSCFNFSCNVNADLFKPPGILSRSAPPHVPFFTPTTLLIKEKGVFCHCWQFLFVDGTFYPRVGRPAGDENVLNMLNTADEVWFLWWRKAARHLPDYKICHILIFECLIRPLSLSLSTLL